MHAAWNCISQPWWIMPPLVNCTTIDNIYLHLLTRWTSDQNEWIHTECREREHLQLMSSSSQIHMRLRWLNVMRDNNYMTKNMWLLIFHCKTIGFNMLLTSYLNLCDEALWSGLFAGLSSSSTPSVDNGFFIDSLYAMVRNITVHCPINKCPHHG